ncbi:MAG: insulinase family protein [Fimbriimonadaceae bacterium]|nr:insulinase family protein [Fimbriimonadaceae bacterium]
MKWTLIATVVLILCGCSKGVAPAPEAAKAEPLKNGLEVVLRPIEGAKSVALVVQYSIGDRNDPEGASGMAHLIEHLLATCATPGHPARDVDTLVDTYPDGFNAQTGDDYTLVSTVFPKERLEAELADAAARMTDLRIEPEDVQRELGRLEVELANMYKSVPSLASQNYAAQAVAPPLVGARRGGVLEQMRAIPLDTLRARVAAYYQPRNAMLVLAGDLAPAQAQAMVEKAFGKISGGEALPEVALARAPVTTGTTELPASGLLGGGYAAVAYPAPSPKDPEYAGFLMLASILQTRAIDFGAPKGVAPVQFAPLDRPEVLIVSAPPLAGEDAAKAATRIEAIVRRELEAAQVDTRLLTRTFGFLLGLEGTPETEMALNPYGVAFGIARRRQLGIDPAALASRINTLSDAELARARTVMLEHVGKAVVRSSAANR